MAALVDTCGKGVFAMIEGKDDLTDNPSHSSVGEMSEKEVDDNLAGTFPASDPPSWTLGTDHRKEPTAEQSPRQTKDEIAEE
jgi:hypothetical protein